MTTDDSGNTTTISPRFEFRTFGRQFDAVARRMEQLSGSVAEHVRERYSDEIYIMSKPNDTNNTKIRYGLMDIKTLIRTVDGLEQWGPLLKAEFPLDAAFLNEQLQPALQIELPALDQADYSLEGFLDMIRLVEGLEAVDVRKHRFGYLVNDTMCEVAEVDINGTKLATVAVESTDMEAIKKTMIDLGLAGIENINYLQAIKRVIGMIDKPLAN